MATDTDYLTIGAGPARLQLGYFLHRAGRDYRVLEAGPTPGTFFRTFPRHRQLISINKRFTGTSDPEPNLRMDWNSLLSDGGPLFTTYSERYFPDAGDMVHYLTDYATAAGLTVSYDTRATRVERRLIVATGPSKPYIPDIPGIELADGYESVSVDAENFTDQRVLIIGKGSSAFETADNLIEHAAVIHLAGPDSVRMSWQSHYVGHLRAVNNNFLDTYQLKSQNAVLDGNILNIARDGDGYVVTVSFSRAEEATLDPWYDRVTGFATDFFVVTLEYGPDHDKVDPFDITVRRVRQDDADEAHDVAYLHPVLRHHRGGELLAEHHVAENLENDWTGEAAHREPLRAFFTRQLAPVPLG